MSCHHWSLIPENQVLMYFLDYHLHHFACTDAIHRNVVYRTVDFSGGCIVTMVIIIGDFVFKIWNVDGQIIAQEKTITRWRRCCTWKSNQRKNSIYIYNIQYMDNKRNNTDLKDGRNSLYATLHNRFNLITQNNIHVSYNIFYTKIVENLLKRN